MCYRSNSLSNIDTKSLNLFFAISTPIENIKSPSLNINLDRERSLKNFMTIKPR